MTYFQLQYPTVQNYHGAVNSRLVDFCALMDNPESMLHLLKTFLTPAAMDVFYELKINHVQATSMVGDMVLSMIETSKGKGTKYSKMK